MLAKFRVKALCRTQYGNVDVTRVLDAADEDQAREKMRQRFSIITVHWIKKISSEVPRG